MEKFQNWLDEQLRNKRKILVLEAGCGSASHLSFKNEAYIVGIDISKEQLLRNKQINEAILGDIQDYRLPSEKFDLIICWAVLEHLLYPEKALYNFINAIKKDGLIVLALPNVLSIKGLVTKYTPFFIHKLYYKKIMGRKIVGKEGYGPFRTYLKFLLAPKILKSYFEKHGFTIEYYETMDISNSIWWKEKSQIARFLMNIYRGLKEIMRIVSFGKLGDSDFILVLKK